MSILKHEKSLPIKDILSSLSMEKNRIIKSLIKEDLSGLEQWALALALTSREKKLVMSGYVEGLNRAVDLIYDCSYTTGSSLEQSTLTTTRGTDKKL